MSDMDAGGMVLGSYAPGRPRAEFQAIQAQRAAELAAKGDAAGAREAQARGAMIGEHSTTARSEAIRDRRVHDA